MATQLDLQLLKAEESALMRISSKLSEQLNRLKVEELALLSQIRKTSDAQDDLFSASEREPDEVRPTTSGLQTEQFNNEPLDLRPSTSNIVGSAEEEEELEEESMDHDQLTALMKQLDKS